MGRADLESVNNIGGIESRGSASLKSYTSYSSIEFNVAPIPECIKNDWVSCEQRYSSLSTLSSNREQETEGSEEREAANIISNLVSNKQMKKTVVFSDIVNSSTSLGWHRNFET